VGGAKLIERDAGIARCLLEGADLLDRPLAQIAGIRLAVGAAQAAKELQQRSGGLDQRVEAERDGFRALGRDWRGGARERRTIGERGRRGGLRRRGAAAAGGRTEDCRSYHYSDHSRERHKASRHWSQLSPG
jgi:hypothetical protein